MAVTVNATECWDIPALEEIRASSGMAAVRAAMAAGDVGPGGARAARAPGAPGAPGAPDAPGADEPSGGRSAGTRPVIFANGFTLSPYAETGSPGGSPKHLPRTRWYASPGSSGGVD
jgi:error-prone DNA polymerase